VVYHINTRDKWVNAVNDPDQARRVFEQIGQSEGSISENELYELWSQGKFAAFKVYGFIIGLPATAIAISLTLVFRRRRRMTNDIDAEFLSRGILLGRTYTFNSDDSLAIIERCRQMDRVIYGIESLIITDKITQVVDYMDYTAIYYFEFDKDKYFEKYHIAKESDRGHWAEAKQFVLDRKDEGLWFEIDHE
jgi:hypothetical protein